MIRRFQPVRQLTLFALIAGLSSPNFAAQPLICLIQPSKIAEIGTSVYGVIERISVERGDQVKKGQVIAVLRNDVERAALDVAKSKAQADADVQSATANVEFTRQRLARAEDLLKKKFISEQALDQNRVEFRVAEQKLALAREQRRIWEREMGLAQSQLSQRTLVSPIDGIVAERYLATGERVENRSVARVVSVHPLHVEVMVPAAQFGKIKPGMMATVMPEIPDAPSIEARVNLVDKLIDGASNTFRVRLELPNPDHALPAGPRCKVAFGDQIIGPDNRASKPSLSSGIPLAKPPPAAPAGSPTPPAAPATPRAAGPSSLEQSALNALEDWRKSWESKALSRYLAAYVSDFRGDRANRSDWIKQREDRLGRPGSLNISISEASVQPVTDDKVRVRFRQKYQADGYRDETVKSVLLALDKGKWLILEELILR